MTCFEAEEALLESLDDALPPAVRRALDAHVATCADCAEFAVRMRAIDRQLVAALPAPEPRPAIAARVREHQPQEPRSQLADSLPDIMHLGGGIAVTALAAALVPGYVPWVLSIGILCTCATYAVLALVRLSLEAVEQPDW